MAGDLLERPPGDFHDLVDRAVHQITEVVLSREHKSVEWPLDQSERWWVPAESSPEMVVEMTRRYGLHHLQEAREALLKLSPDLRSRMTNEVHTTLGFNSGAGLVEMLFRLVGLGGHQTIMVDHSDSCGLVSLELSEQLGITDVDFINSTKDLGRICPITTPVLLIASHALNVRYTDEFAQTALESQNLDLLRCLEQNCLSETYLCSIEPYMGRNKVPFLTRPFQDTGRDCESVAIDSVNNQTWLQTGLGGRTKTVGWAVAAAARKKARL